MKEITINRNFKDRVFCMLFSEPKNALQLYNALNDTNYTDTTDLKINTLDNAIFLKMKNDVSFLINNFMNLYEQQSTWNLNMPFRCFLYLGDLYTEWASAQKVNFYRTNLVKIPTPKVVVLYNGEKEIGEEVELYLSDAFEQPQENPQLELRVHVINMNFGKNENLLNKCSILYEYSAFIAKTRKYAKILSIEEAVIKSIDESIEEGILAQFLKVRRADVMKSILTEYDEEFVMKDLQEEAKELGRTEGLTEGLAKGRTVGLTEGLAKGRTEGESRFSRLTEFLLDDNRLNDLKKATKDTTFRATLYKEYKIE
ncbi:MAG: hypothetical protein PHD70_14665 [Anaerostipes sp.]|nr:hypothetical protein [Anaerostipes sp.]